MKTEQRNRLSISIHQYYRGNKDYVDYYQALLEGVILDVTTQYGIISLAHNKTLPKVDSGQFIRELSEEKMVAVVAPRQNRESHFVAWVETEEGNDHVSFEPRPVDAMAKCAGKIAEQEIMENATQQSIKTLDLALAELKNGKPNEAWEIARKDQLLDKEVTKEQWLAFAAKALALRADDQNQQEIINLIN